MSQQAVLGKPQETDIRGELVFHQAIIPSFPQATVASKRPFSLGLKMLMFILKLDGPQGEKTEAKRLATTQ